MVFLNGQLVTVSSQEVMVSVSVSDLTKVEAATAEAAKRAKVANCIVKRVTRVELRKENKN